VFSRRYPTSKKEAVYSSDSLVPTQRIMRIFRDRARRDPVKGEGIYFMKRFSSIFA
jgi:hypothetical protein